MTNIENRGFHTELIEKGQTAPFDTYRVTDLIDGRSRTFKVDAAFGGTYVDGDSPIDVLTREAIKFLNDERLGNRNG